MKTTLKSIVTKVMTAGLLAGAFILGTPQKAEAQVHVGVGVVVGGPVYRPYPYPVYRPYPAYRVYRYPAYYGPYAYRPYYGPGYYRPGYYSRGYYRGPVRVHPGYGYYGRR
ncbi:MAG TPA: hypothetical protein VIM62_10585 [Acidobacteriaceae bacterium]